MSLIISENWIPGTPAPFATRMETSWKDQLYEHLAHSTNCSELLDLAFTLPEGTDVYKGYDLDNLCHPVFSVWSSGLGWFDGKQRNIAGWRATKKTGANTGLRLRHVSALEDRILQEAVLFDGIYDGKLPSSARDPDVPAWLQGLGIETGFPESCGLSLTFVNIKRSIASLSDGVVKHVIDCLFPLIGGTVGMPNDHLIASLSVRRVLSSAESPYMGMLKKGL